MEVPQGGQKVTMEDILAECEEQEGDLTADVFLAAQREAIPELIERGVLSDAEDELSVNDTATSPREFTGLLRKANKNGTLSGVESADGMAEPTSPATSQRTTASIATSGSMTVPSLYKPGDLKMPLPNDLQERLKIVDSKILVKQYGLSKNQVKSLRKNTKQLLALERPDAEKVEIETAVSETDQTATVPTDEEQKDDAIEAPESQVTPAIPPTASVDSDGQSEQDKSQASSYHSEDQEDTAGGLWSSPILSCMERREVKEAKKKAHQEAAKAAKKKSKAEKKKARDSPHPKELDQQRREERGVKHKRRVPDDEFDGLTTFKSPDKAGMKRDQSKDEESATSTPDSKKDFHKAEQN